MSIPPTFPKGLLLGKTAEGEYIPILIDGRSRNFILSPESTGLDGTPEEEAPTQIVNGDFSLPDMEGWEVVGENITQNMEDEDAEFDYIPTETPVVESISQEVDVTEHLALTYEIVGSHGDGEGNGHLAVKIDDVLVKYHPDPQSIEDWTEQEVNIAHLTGVVNIKFEMYRDNHSNNGKMKLDNVTLGRGKAGAYLILLDTGAV